LILAYNIAANRKFNDDEIVEEVVEEKTPIFKRIFKQKTNQAKYQK
jgi:hypothetical protein